MASASLLLSYVPQSDSRATPAKIFEYLATGRPILSVAQHDNPSYRLVEELGAGYCAEPHEDDRIEEALLDAYRRWREGRLEAPAQARAVALERFSRQAQAGQLARVFGSLSDSREADMKAGRSRR
jgi:glycosyltransferase involved in cell wall biosynthesis